MVKIARTPPHLLVIHTFLVYPRSCQPPQALWYGRGMPASLQSRITLNNGTEMPVFGLGVWKIPDGPECEQAVTWALETGYRMIDTATLYGNEGSVGRAVREFIALGGARREDIFVTTKLWPTDFLNPLGAFRKSLNALGFDYVDLYLIHWPLPIMPKKIWQTLEEIYENGGAKAIGVSNYDPSGLDKLLTYAKVPPAVNQVEFNPEVYDRQLLEYCRTKNIAVEAYSPLGQGSLVTRATAVEIAAKVGKTPAQVLLRWALQKGTIPIPKSSQKERIIENSQVFDFELSAEDMLQLDAIS